MLKVEQVTHFLERVADAMLSQLSSAELAALDGLRFEKLVFEFASELNTRDKCGFTVRETKKQAFPDIVIDEIGIEVKSTVKDHWVTTGNSIQESQRDPEVKEILFFFGKLGGVPKIAVRRYEECLRNVVVTHNPRYQVDMNLQAGQSIFSKMGLAYEEFRNLQEPMLRIKKIARESLKPGETLWWLNDSEENATLPVLRDFSNLSGPEKQSFRVQAMALCPEIFGKSTTKYDRIPALLLNAFSAVTPNVRDKFSAGGKETLALNQLGEFQIRSIDAKLYSNANEIAKFITNAPEDLLAEHWKVAQLPEQRITFYASLLNKNTQNVVGEILVGDIFLAGLSPFRD